MTARRSISALSLLVLLAVGACATIDETPRDLQELHRYLLLKAKQKFKHALRITERHSPDPFNQARQQLVYTLIELEEFAEAEKTGREFVRQKKEYLEVARTKLAEAELDWKKELAGNPKIKGTRKETDYIEAQDLWKMRMRLAEKQIVGLSLLLGEVFLRSRKFKMAIPIFKEILDIQADHNTALRRIGQTHVLLGDHNLGAMYFEKAHMGIMNRIREIREGLEEEESGETGGESPGEITPPDTSTVQTREQQIGGLTQAAIEIASVVGVLHYITGNYPKAEDWFARAFELDPTSYFLDLKLGLTLLREGRTSKATEHFDKFRKGLEGCEGVLVLTLLDRIEKKDSKNS